jgi:NADH-quinone oxidoreductase subunit L
MLSPLLLLALGSIGAGFVPVPEMLKPIFLAPVRVAAEHHASWLPWAATGVALAGLLSAYYLYVLYADVPGRIYGALRGFARVLEEKYGFDLAFDWLAGAVVAGGSERVLWKRVDAGLIDGAVDGTAAIVARVARTGRALQTGLVRTYALMMFAGAVALLYYLFWIGPT